MDNFDSIELRRVKNGVIVALRTNEEDAEYIFDTNRKALKFVKDLLEGKVVLEKPEDE
jgi:hypothetical protein